MPQPTITLTTDFGACGPYVAAMKGAILGINPDARLLDVSHAIEPQNVRQAAFLLTQVGDYFPPGTIHVVVVDPGVGTGRRLLCVRMRRQTFLAPDNGVLSWMARGEESVDRRVIMERRFWRAEVSPTFHGRDILAPVAGHLSLGIPVQELGPPTDHWAEIRWPEPQRDVAGIAGEVMAVDPFGNLITNISAADVSSLGAPPVAVRLQDHVVKRIVQTYAEANPGETLALIGSGGFMEIAVRGGNAAEKLRATVGTRVTVLLLHRYLGDD